MQYGLGDGTGGGLDVCSSISNPSVIYSIRHPSIIMFFRIFTYIFGSGGSNGHQDQMKLPALGGCCPCFYHKV